MLGVPLLTGLGAGGGLSWQGIVLALTATSFYLLRYPLMLAVKSLTGKRGWEGVTVEIRVWTVTYAVLTMIGGVLLLWMGLGPELIWLAGLAGVLLAAYLLLAARRAEMSLMGELVGVAGLALGAPFAYLVTRGRLDLDALLLWALNTLYFSGTVLYIKFKAREQPRMTAPARVSGRLRAGLPTLVFHLFTLAAVLALAAAGHLPTVVLLAFVPGFAKAIWGVVQWTRRPNLKRLGMTELAHAAFFAAALCWAFVFH